MLNLESFIFFQTLKCLFKENDPDLLLRVKKIEDGKGEMFFVEKVEKRVENHFSALSNPIGLSSGCYLGSLRNEVDGAVSFLVH